MRKILLYLAIFLFCFNAGAQLPPWLAGGEDAVKKDTNCNQAKYFPLGTLCQDTDDGKLYKGTGAAVEEIAEASGDGAPTDAHYLTDQAEGDLSAEVVVSTIGKAVATSTNPGAITFGRANADNTFSWLSDSDFRTAIGVIDWTADQGTTNIHSGNIPTLNQSTSGSAASLSISGQTGLVSFTGLTSTNRIKTVRDAADTLLELGGSYTPTGTWNWTSATWSNVPTLNQNTTGTAAGLTAQYIDWNEASGGKSIANKPTIIDWTSDQEATTIHAGNIPDLSGTYLPLWDYDYGDLINTPTIPTVNDSITDSNTTSAPSENAVFDALALKAPINNPTFTGGISIAGTTAGGQYMFLREDTDNTADNYTGWGVYGELAHDTIYAFPLAAPVTGQIMSWATPGNQTMSDGSTQSISVGTFAYKDYAQTPVIGDADDFDDNCTGACLYGGTFIVTAAGTAVLPNATAGMNFTIILEGANATIIDPLGTGTADAIHMNGLAAADDENITSSTSGATCVIQYRSADHWSATCNGFAEATPPE